LFDFVLFLFFRVLFVKCNNSIENCDESTFWEHLEGLGLSIQYFGSSASTLRLKCTCARVPISYTQAHMSSSAHSMGLRAHDFQIAPTFLLQIEFGFSLPRRLGDSGRLTYNFSRVSCKIPQIISLF
jgi:hypothetical protein